RRRGFGFPYAPLVGFKAGVGGGISLAVGKAGMHSFLLDISFAITAITIGLLEHDFRCLLRDQVRDRMTAMYPINQRLTFRGDDGLHCRNLRLVDETDHVTVSGTTAEGVQDSE
ncbi:hypothetical protein V8E53_007613, partial [Lactarius tabidus]